MTGANLYVYKQLASAAAAEGKPEASPTAGKKRPNSAVASMPCDDEDDEDEEDEEDDKDDMSCACEVTAIRLHKMCKKETLVILCGEFGIPSSGNKEKLAADISEQLHYETDTDIDEDDE